MAHRHQKKKIILYKWFEMKKINIEIKQLKKFNNNLTKKIKLYQNKMEQNKKIKKIIVKHHQK